MVKKIMWDKAHRNTPHDYGASANELRESDLSNKIVDYAMAYMSNHYIEFEQRVTRGNNEVLALNNRDDEADSWKADVFISPHINAGGKKRKNLAVLRETSMPAVLTENLFIDTPSDAQLLKKEDFLRAVGGAHAMGVAKFLGLPEKQQVKASEAPQVEPKLRYFHTGGYLGQSTVTIHTFLQDNGFYFVPSRGDNGSLFFLIGGFSENTDKFNEMERFLKDRRYWYEIRK